MKTSFDKTSFIPQKSLTPNGVRKRKSLGLFFIIAVLLFVISIAGAVGVIGYKKIIEKSIDGKAVSLQRAKEAFDPGLIEDLTRLDSRIELTQGILDSHLAITPLLNLVEELTLKKVRLEQFEFIVRESGTMTLTMAGQAVDYATVVSQSDLLGQNRFLKDQIFSNINLDSSGNVSFSINATVDKGIVSFRNNVEGF
jgi:hypothetical protein